MFTLLALLAFNAMQVYVYRHLRLQPGAAHLCLLDYREDMRDTMILCGQPRRPRLHVIQGHPCRKPAAQQRGLLSGQPNRGP